MRDSLSYRISDDGEGGFNRAIAQAKKWIGANINGPLKLTFAISLKAVAGEGESVQMIQATENLLNGKPRADLDMSSACAHRDHKRCTYEKCACACHEGQSARLEP